MWRSVCARGSGQGGWLAKNGRRADRELSHRWSEPLRLGHPGGGADLRRLLDQLTFELVK